MKHRSSAAVLSGGDQQGGDRNLLPYLQDQLRSDLVLPVFHSARQSRFLSVASTAHHHLLLNESHDTQFRQ